MIPRDMVMGIFLFLQIGVGILGNWSLLIHYVLLLFAGKTLTPKDMIIKHLTFANSLAIISRGIPQTIAEFGWKYFLNDIGCKLLLYLYRVSRGISLYTTCLLSCFQAITINPTNTRWMMLKHRATKYIGPSCLISWLVHLLLNIIVPIRVTGPRYSRNVTERLNIGYCSGIISDPIATTLYMLMLCCTDVLCLGLMAWASGSMVSILYRHKRQVQYLHSAHHSARVSPESRATQMVLVLVCSFLTFYSVSTILVLYMALFDRPGLWLINFFAFVETCFPSFSPFVLISNKNSVSRIYFPCCGKI